MKHGIVAAIVMANLVRNVGRKAAFELVATGEPVDAARALALGHGQSRDRARCELMAEALQLAGEVRRGQPSGDGGDQAAVLPACSSCRSREALAAGRDVNKRMRAFRKS